MQKFVPHCEERRDAAISLKPERIGRQRLPRPSAESLAMDEEWIPDQVWNDNCVIPHSSTSTSAGARG